MDKETKGLLGGAARDVVIDERDGEDRILKAIERLGERLDSALKRIEDKIDSLS